MQEQKQILRMEIIETFDEMRGQKKKRIDIDSQKKIG